MAVNHCPPPAVKNIGVCRVSHGSSPIVNVSGNPWLGFCRMMMMMMLIMVLLTMMLLLVLVLVLVLKIL